MKKHFKKSPVRNTLKRCIECDKVLTTIDMCYSSNISICWDCDKKPKQIELF